MNCKIEIEGMEAQNRKEIELKCPPIYYKVLGFDGNGTIESVYLQTFMLLSSALGVLVLLFTSVSPWYLLSNLNSE